MVTVLTHIKDLRTGDRLVLGYPQAPVEARVNVLNGGDLVLLYSEDGVQAITPGPWVDSEDQYFYRVGGQLPEDVPLTRVEYRNAETGFVTTGYAPRTTCNTVLGYEHIDERQYYGPGYWA